MHQRAKSRCYNGTSSVTSSNTQNTALPGGCWVKAFPINSPDSKLQHFIFPETSQVRSCGFSMAKSSCSQLMFCQAAFLPKPSQEKTHKYSYKQVTYFPADMHFAFHCFHSVFSIHRVHIVIGKAAYMRKVNWHNLNSTKTGVKTCVDTFHWRLEYFDLM